MRLSITALVTLQEWDFNNNVQHLGECSVEVADRALALSADDVRKLDSDDQLAEGLVKGRVIGLDGEAFSGPNYISVSADDVVAAVGAALGEEIWLEDLTDEHMSRARAVLRGGLAEISAAESRYESTRRMSAAMEVLAELSMAELDAVTALARAKKLPAEAVPQA